nr:membrane-associated tyrosine- and threonine-specific cdc2-inhibitory kinase-like [Lytechinus pictus]
MTRFVTLFALNVVHGDVSCHPVIVCPTGILANGTAVRELLKLANKDMLEGAKGMAEVLNQRDIGRPLVCAMPDCIPDPCYGDMNMCTETDTGYICSKPDETAENLRDFTDAQEGDPKYLAPELLQGHFGMHADVFSLGITIFELASDLELPRNGDSWHDLRRGRIPWQLTAGISSDLKGLIKNMMNPDFQKRPSLADLMETSVLQRTISWQRRKRALCRMWNKFQGFLSLLFTLLSAAVFKILSPSKHSINQDEIDAPVIKHRHPSSWDLSFSDDEIFESDISHGSLGCPLGSLSFSSEEDACNIQHTKPIHNSKNILTPSTPTLLKKKKKCGGPTPRSSSPITKSRQPAKLSPCGSPNVSLVRGAEWIGTPTRPSPSRTSVLLTPRCTPSKLDFSSIDSETERHSCMIEPRSLSLEFDELGEDSD